MAHAEPVSVEKKPGDERPGDVDAVKPVEVDVDAAKVAVRDDLPAGHWLSGKRAARVVWSGELDKVVIDGELKAFACDADLAVAEKRPAPEPIEEPKPVEPVEPGDEKPIDEELPDVGEVVRVR